MFFLEPFVLKIFVVVAGFFTAAAGLAFFALRRRGEILEDYLAPNDEHLEDDFFRRFLERKRAEETLKKQLAEQQNDEDAGDAQWGDM